MLAPTAPKSKRDVGKAVVSKSFAGGRAEFQKEQLDLWLGALAGGYVKPPDEIKADLPKKRSGAAPPVSLIWMEAMSDPAVKESNALLSRIVLEEMPRKRPIAYSIIHYLYVREYASPADAERWRFSTDDKYDKLRLKLLSKARKWILDRLEELDPGHVIAVPDAINPRGFVQRSRKQQSIARRVFYQNVDKVGAKKAVKRASDISRYSERHVRNLIPKEDRSGT